MDARSCSPTAGQETAWIQSSRSSTPPPLSTSTVGFGAPMITATRTSALPLGKTGKLVAVAARVGTTTALPILHTEGTLKPMRVHHLDTARPAMAFLTLASPGCRRRTGDLLQVALLV